MKKRWGIVFISYVGLFIVFFNCFANGIHAAANEFDVDLDEKVYYKTGVQDETSDDCILVSLTKKFSKSGKELRAKDFKIDNIKDFEYLISDIYPDEGKSNKYDRKQASHAEIDSLTNVDEFRQIVKITISNPGKANVLATIRKLEKLNFIRSASPNSSLSTMAVTTVKPNDPYYLSGEQWGLENANFPKAWNVTTGYTTRPVRVGVIDTGIAPHPDLNDHLVSGWNFVSKNSNTNDTNGHGTHVAGIIGAKGNNGVGVSGANWNVELVPLKVGNDGNFLKDAIVSAINYARVYDIKIINCSFGSTFPDQEIKDALMTYRGLVVCGAGNDNRDLAQYPIYPACYSERGKRLDNIMSIGAINATNERATGWTGGKGSNYNKEMVDMFAPGDNIYSTIPGGSYAYKSGTSMAAPYVTGIAALIMSTCENIGYLELKHIIVEGVVPLHSLTGFCASSGRLDAYTALQRSRVTHIHSFLKTITEHNKICTCGSASGYVLHSYTYKYYPILPKLGNPDAYHSAICDCGESSLKRHSFVIMSPTQAICSKCNYSVNPMTTPIINPAKIKMDITDTFQIFQTESHNY